MHASQGTYLSSRHIGWALLILLSVGMGVSLLWVKIIYLAAAVAGIAFLVVIFRYPYMGLIAYLFIFMIRLGEKYPALSVARPELAVGILAMLSVILSQLINHGNVKLPKDKISLLLYAFFAVMGLTIFTSFSMGATKDTMVEFLKLMIFYLLIVMNLTSARRVNLFLIGFTLLLIYTGIDAYKAYASGDFDHTMGMDRLQGGTSAGGGPNAIAATMAASIPLVVAAALSMRNILYNVGFWGAGLFLAYIATLTGSRSGFLGLISTILAGYAFSKRKLMIGALLVVFLLVGWTVIPQQYQTRYLTLTEVEDLNESSTGRWEVWKAGVRMFLARPVLGVGAGAFKEAYITGAFGPPQWMQAHNLYVQLLATTGIVGFAVWFAFLSRVIRTCLRLRRQCKLERDRFERNVYLFTAAFIVSIVSLLVAGVFGHSLYRYTWYLIAACVVSFESIVRERLATEKTS